MKKILGLILMVLVILSGCTVNREESNEISDFIPSTNEIRNNKDEVSSDEVIEGITVEGKIDVGSTENPSKEEITESTGTIEEDGKIVTSTVTAEEPAISVDKSEISEEIAGEDIIKIWGNLEVTYDDILNMEETKTLQFEGDLIFESDLFTIRIKQINKSFIQTNMIFSIENRTADKIAAIPVPDGFQVNNKVVSAFGALEAEGDSSAEGSLTVTIDELLRVDAQKIDSISVAFIVYNPENKETLGCCELIELKILDN